MQILPGNQNAKVRRPRPKQQATVEAQAPQHELMKKTDVAAGTFSAKRDITYAAGATLGLLPGAISGVTGNLYGVPHMIVSAGGGLMAAAGAREVMVNETFHGRMNGAIHFAVGAMTAAAPWSGNLSVPLYIASMAALGVKAVADQPGNLLKTAASETWQMAKEVTTGWKASGQETTPAQA